MHTCMCVYVHACVHVCVYMCVCVCVCVCAWVGGGGWCECVGGVTKTKVCQAFIKTWQQLWPVPHCALFVVVNVTTIIFLNLSSPGDAVCVR